MVNNQDLPLGHQVHSPKHNRFDSIRDEDVYNSVGQPGTSQSNWSRSVTSSSLKNKFKERVSAQTHGLTSEQFAHKQDPRSKKEGGEIGACINYDYERDYVLEAMLQDKMLQDKKQRKKSFDYRRTTKAHEGNVLAAKKRIT